MSGFAGVHRHRCNALHLHMFCGLEPRVQLLPESSLNITPRSVPLIKRVGLLGAATSERTPKLSTPFNAGPGLAFVDAVEQTARRRPR